MRTPTLAAVALLATGLAAPTAHAQRMSPTGAPMPTSGSSSGVTLRCSKQRDHAVVYNGGPGMLATGTVIEVHATGATQEAEGTGNGTLDHALAPQQSWVHPIRFSINFTQCTAKVVSQP